MQNQKVREEYMFLAIPMEVIEESGVKDGQVLEFTAEEGKITIQTVMVQMRLMQMVWQMLILRTILIMKV